MFSVDGLNGEFQVVIINLGCEPNLWHRSASVHGCGMVVVGGVGELAVAGCMVVSGCCVYGNGCQVCVLFNVAGMGLWVIVVEVRCGLA